MPALPVSSDCPTAATAGPPEDPFPARAAACSTAAWCCPPDLPTVAVAATLSPVYVGLVVVGAGMASFGALATASLISYSPTRLRQYLEADARADRADCTAEIDRRDGEYLALAALVTAAGWILSLWSLERAIDPANFAWALAVVGFGLVLGAGCLPAAVAQARPERSLLLVVPTLRALWYALRWPVVLPLVGVTRGIVRLLRLDPPARPDTADVQAQVLAAVADTVTDESLAPTERTWIGNIVGLKDVQVSTLMTPRPDIVAFAESMSVGDAIQKALEHGFSRYPVYRERIDEVVGTFNVKDALVLARADQKALAATTLRSMLRPPLFVPETTGAAKLLHRFQAGNQHLAIVIDEYGTTVGLVTVEDILEEIVGEIADEYDAPSTSPADPEQVRVIEAGRVLELPARLTVADLNRALGCELPVEGDWETVAGLVIAHLNHIPVVDETIVVQGVEFRVLQADERRVRRLRATLLTPEAAEGRS